MIEHQKTPVDYWAVVWIEAAALRSTPDIYAPIEGAVHRGDELHIIDELDGLCKTDSGMWVLKLTLKKQQKMAGQRTGPVQRRLRL